MTVRLLQSASVIAALCVIAACNDDAVPITAPPITSVAPARSGAVSNAFDYTWDLEGQATDVECPTGDFEGIRLHGQVHERVTFIDTPSGNTLARLEVTPMGLYGTGLESGAEYRIDRQESGGQVSQVEFFNWRWRMRMTLSSKETGARIRMTYASHYGVNANGYPTVERDIEEITCAL